MVAIPQEFADLLHTATLAHGAIIGPKGEPQNTPVWFDWDGNHIRFSQTKARQKFRSLQRDPRIALEIIDPSIPYRSLEIRGKVVRIEEDPDLHFLNAMTKKHLGQDAYPWDQPGEEHFVIIVQPEHTTRPLRKPWYLPCPFLQSGRQDVFSPAF
jgi:PPOX class probable F420-dependent enzyme